MKKKYYYFLEKREVTLGDVIEYEGMSLTVTEDLIRDLPNLFERIDKFVMGEPYVVKGGSGVKAIYFYAGVHEEKYVFEALNSINGIILNNPIENYKPIASNMYVSYLEIENQFQLASDSVVRNKGFEIGKVYLGISGQHAIYCGINENDLLTFELLTAEGAKEKEYYPENYIPKTENGFWAFKEIENQFNRTQIEGYQIPVKEHELLTKAKRDYPVGTRYNSLGGWCNRKIKCTNGFTYNKNCDQRTIDYNGTVIYKRAEDKWANKYLFTTEDERKIYQNDPFYYVSDGNESTVEPIWEVVHIEDGLTELKDGFHKSTHLFSTLEAADNFIEDSILFVTEDEVNVFRGDKVTAVNINSNTIESTSFFKGNSTYFKYFSTRELAEEYIESLKEKTLEDYENNLMTKETIITGYNGISKHDFYMFLKKEDPKLYYLKVLQLIADDLNKGLTLPESQDQTYTINLEYDKQYGCILSWGSGNTSKVVFATSELAEEAIKIMGDKLDFIYKY